VTNEAAPAVEQAESITGLRIVAGIIDAVVLGVVFVIMSALFGESESSSGDGGASFEVNLSGGPFIIFLLMSLAYYLFPEAMTGQTLGKKIMRLKVVSLDGGTLSWGKVAMRTILRIIDGFPWIIPYLVGIISIAVSKKQQRIGDMAAGTRVVRA
jgi:uncharacterized RDD family membrane protein YckC